MNMLPNDVRYQMMPLSKLKPRKRRTRKHTNKQIKQIAASILQFGFINPIVVDEQNIILAGHARFEAAKDLRLTEVPTVQVSSMTEEDKRAYVIADNRLAELSEWDFEVLAEEVEFLLQADLNFDIDIIGFDAADIDGWSKPTPSTEPELVELPSAGPAVTQLWEATAT